MYLSLTLTAEAQTHLGGESPSALGHISSCRDKPKKKAFPLLHQGSAVEESLFEARTGFSDSTCNIDFMQNPITITQD